MDGRKLTQLEEIDQDFILNTIPPNNTMVNKLMPGKKDYSYIVKIPDEYRERLRTQNDILLNNGFISNELNAIFQEYVNLSIDRFEFEDTTREIQNEYKDFKYVPNNKKIKSEPFDPIDYHIMEMKKEKSRECKTIDKLLNLKIKKKTKRIFIPVQKNII